MNARRFMLLSMLAATTARTSQAQTTVRQLRRQILSGQADGLDANFVEVTIPPGPGNAAHRHSGFVLGYVLEGEFLFGINGEKPQRLKAGETFYEPEGGRHTTSASALPDKPVRILAIVVGPKGQAISQPDTKQ
jgi:quercetin dioxygenase-like cupin family protein